MVNSKGANCYISIIIPVLLLVLISPPFAYAENPAKKNVLVLNSYHKGYKWTDSITEGITSVLGPNARMVNLHIEDMDTKRISDTSYINKLYEVYKYKFVNKKFDAIICSDDTAFQFLLKYHNELFPGTPIIFCGINYFDDSMIADEPLITGVVELYDIRATLSTALELHPGTRNVYVINDNTITGQGVNKVLSEVMEEFDNQVTFHSLQNLTMDQVLNNVKNLPPDSIVLFLVFFEDALGQYYSYDESISRISASSNVPVYGVWDFNLGHGIVGGMLTNGFYQGETAAKLAARILAGEPPSTVPVVKRSINKYMFDHSQMVRFGLKNEQMPQNSIIINEVYSNKRQVLVLNSYHPDMAWVRNIEAGIQSVFGNAKNVNFYYDYMDTKRNVSPEYIQQLNEVFKTKYSDKKFDAIIVCDDLAYNYILDYHSELFGRTPVVFCGVNNFKATDLAEDKWFTGVVETIDIKETIRLALKLHPDTKNIVVINDKTAVGVANKKQLFSVITEFPQVNFSIYEDMNMSEVQDKVAKLGSDSIILLLTFNQDKSNNVFSYEESCELIAEKANVPIYGIWDFYLEHGMVGGLMTSGYAQGQMAAELARRILSGESPANIEIMQQSPNRYIFDYAQLKKFNIDINKLPPDSIMVNRPSSFYEQNKVLVCSVGMVILLLACVIFLMYINILKRKKAEAELTVYATTDGLTGVLNRRTGLELLFNQLRQADQLQQKLTLCFLDINDLKIINDNCGHEKGDRLIQVVIQLIRQTLRQTDSICRFGGDEFLIAFTDCSLEQAANLWCRIQEKFDIFNAREQECFHISVSHGFAEYDPKNPLPVDVLISIADSAMYRVKATYKNTGEKVEIADDKTVVGD